MEYSVVSVEQAGHVATITLNRPERLNALDTALSAELHVALDEVSGRFPEVRAVVLTGAGRGFCSGQDMALQARAIEGEAQAEADALFWSIMELAPHIRRVAQPVIAAVNGAAVGAGLSLALACDIRVASEGARFSALFVKRAYVPDTGASVTLPDLAGLGVAAEMAYTGAMYDARWALAKRLVNRVVPADRLLEEATGLAEEIAANPPLTVRAIKQLLHRRQSLDPALAEEYRANVASLHSEDRREAVRSFVEKREPQYRGR